MLLLNLYGVIKMYADQKRFGNIRNLSKDHDKSINHIHRYIPVPPGNTGISGSIILAGKACCVGKGLVSYLALFKKHNAAQRE